MFPLHLSCIRVAQPIGDFFLCSIEANVLKEVAYWIPATAEKKTSSGFFKLRGVQRRMSSDRAKEIGEYIDSTEATFPNSIILGANYDQDDNHEEDEQLRWRVIEKKDGCYELIIPTSKKLASVIDGQHRLAGFDFARKEGRVQMQLPCAVFLDLPKAYQANIFATINFNQKRVDKSLAYELFGYELDESNKQKWPPNMLALFLARILNTESTSPFHEHVKLALAESEDSSLRNEKMESTWMISIATLVEGISRLVTSDQARDKNLLLSGDVSGRRELPVEEGRAPLRQLYLQSEDRKIYEIVASYFDVIRNVFWEKAAGNSFIIRTVGVQATFDILRIALTRGRIHIDDVSGSAIALFQDFPQIDFSGNFFHASGAGRTRIRNILGIGTGLFQYEDIKNEEMQTSVRNLLAEARKHSQ